MLLSRPSVLQQHMADTPGLMLHMWPLPQYQQLKPAAHHPTQ
jgi:hypothetical protein